MDSTENIVNATNTLDNMQEELRCSICYRLFVKATTLMCSHTFCCQCVNQWKLLHSDCPVCRKQIKGMAPSRALDNMVAAITNNQKPRHTSEHHQAGHKYLENVADSSFEDETESTDEEDATDEQEFISDDEVFESSQEDIEEEQEEDIEEEQEDIELESDVDDDSHIEGFSDIESEDDVFEINLY